MRVSIIVAMAENGVIGRDGDLPWRLPRDLRRFKQITMGHVLVMGRRTFESIGRALPGRTSIVVTRQRGYQPSDETVRVAHSLEEALDLNADREVFVIGGAEMYRAAAERADRLFLTRVLAHVDGNVHFPDIDWSRWRLVETESFPPDEKNQYATQFCVYQRDGPSRARL